jgi:hypothetical protein
LGQGYASCGDSFASLNHPKLQEDKKNTGAEFDGKHIFEQVSDEV